MRQAEAEQNAQRGEPRGQNEGSARRGGDVKEESTCRRAKGDTEAGGCCLLAEFPTLRAPGLGRDAVSQDRGEDASGNRQAGTVKAGGSGARRPREISAGPPNAQGRQRG